MFQSKLYSYFNCKQWRCKLLAAFTVSFVITFLFQMAKNPFDATEIHYEDIECIFPQIDPFDPTITDYIEHPAPLECTRMQPFLTSIDTDGVLKLNQTELNSLSDDYTDIVCYYRTFERGSKYKEIDYDSEIELIVPTKLMKDLVEVNCSARTLKGEILTDFYYNLHAHPAKRLANNFAKPTDKKLSVLFMAIDSMSMSLLKRNMPLTYDYITKEMGMKMFESFNKVGDNTVPNMVAALTGKRIYNEQDNMPADLRQDNLQISSDYLPLIWKKFAEKGYATVFNEDRPDVGLFGSSVLPAFQKKHFDYYYSPFWEAIQNDFKSRNLSHFLTYCFRNFRNGDIFVDISKRHVMNLNDYLQFTYSFFVYYSHEQNGIMIENADQVHKSFFEDSFQSGFFNKTVIIFMGDHGQRFSIIRKTMVGLLEERNPMFGIWFPDWFYKLHPHIKKNLISNKNKLAATFDIHETLLDILNGNYDGQQRNLKNRALSLLYPLPAGRGCTSAGIPWHYCLCFKSTALDANLEHIQRFAVIIVKWLNKQLLLFDQCEKIYYESTIRAESLDFNEKVKSGARESKNPSVPSKLINAATKKNSQIRLAVKTQPNNALFEALFLRNSRTQKWFIEGGVQRLSSYGNTSHCINDTNLKKYCTCKDAIL